MAAQACKVPSRLLVSGRNASGLLLALELVLTVPDLLADAFAKLDKEILGRKYEIYL